VKGHHGSSDDYMSVLFINKYFNTFLWLFYVYEHVAVHSGTTLSEEYSSAIKYDLCLHNIAVYFLEQLLYWKCVYDAS